MGSLGRAALRLRTGGTHSTIFGRAVTRAHAQSHLCATAARSFSAQPLKSPDWGDASTYAPTRLPIDEASTLPGAVYHDEDFYRREQQTLWQGSWVAVAEHSDVANPGDVVPAEVGGLPILVANDRGTLRAFHNVCSHRGAQLVTEPCTRRKTILCPYHRWGYALDGRLMGTPAFDDDESGKRVPEALREHFKTHHVKNFDKASMGLKPVTVDSAFVRGSAQQSNARRALPFPSPGATHALPLRRGAVRCRAPGIAGPSLHQRQRAGAAAAHVAGRPRRLA